MRDKVVGEFGGATGATALAQRIEWTAEERAVGARMDSEQRLAKVLVRVVSGDTPPPHDRVDDVVSAMQPMLYATPKTSSAVDTDQADNDNDDDTQTSHDAAPRRKRRAPSGSPNAKRRRPPVSAEDIRAFDFGDDVECGSPAKNKDGSARTTTGLDASPSIGVVASATPSGRWGHTMTAVDDSGSNFVVFGGQGDGDDMVRDRLWRLQGSVWHDEPSSLGQVPMGRMGHTTVLDVDAARLVVFGGSKNMRWFNDVHAYSLASREWTQVKVSPSTRVFRHISTLSIRICVCMCVCVCACVRSTQERHPLAHTTLQQSSVVRCMSLGEFMGMRPSTFPTNALPPFTSLILVRFICSYVALSRVLTLALLLCV